MTMLDKDKRRAWAREYYKKHPEKWDWEKNKHYRRKMLYGITEEEYLSLKEKQGGNCCLCGRPPGNRGLHVDHNHETGKVRGLLCMSCNLLVAAVESDKLNGNLLAKILEYLK